MTVLQQLLDQIEHLSSEEKAVVRKRLDQLVAKSDSILNCGPSIAQTVSQTELWGMFAQDADVLDDIVKTIYKERENRPLRAP